MAVYICKVCGGSLDIDGNEKIVECEYCGTKQTIDEMQSETITVNIVNNVSSVSSVNTEGPSADSLLERAFLFLEDNYWKKADEYCEKVLNIEPQNAKAYLCKLMAELHVKKQEDLSKCPKPFDYSYNYEKVIRFGDKELVSTLEGYIEQIKERNELNRLERIYAHGIEAMNKAGTPQEFKNAANVFAAIQEYKDAAELMRECAKKAEEASAEANKIFKVFLRIVGAVAIGVVMLFIYNLLIVPNMNYSKAVSALEKKDYVAAYELLTELDDFKDASALFENNKDAIYKALLESAEIGKPIYFGAYEQDNDTNNGKEDIEWIVLDKQDGKMLVISKYALEIMIYDEYEKDDEPAVWETSTLRAWLNGTFMDEAFSTEEKSAVLSTTIVNKDGESDTTDQVFLLSAEEAELYFEGDEEREVSPTKNTGDVIFVGGCKWWLRTQGSDEATAVTVSEWGEINRSGDIHSSERIGVRPAMWIEIE